MKIDPTQPRLQDNVTVKANGWTRKGHVNRHSDRYLWIKLEKEQEKEKGD